MRRSKIAAPHIVKLLALLHFSNGFQNGICHEFQLLGRQAVNGQVGEAVIKEFFTHGAGLGDLFLAVAVGLENVKVEQRAEVRDVGNTLLGQLLLQSLYIAASLLGIDLQQIQMVSGLHIGILSKRKNKICCGGYFEYGVCCHLCDGACCMRSGG